MKKALIIDSSLGMTGALRSAFYTAKAMGDKKDVFFAIPKKSEASKYIMEEGYVAFSLPGFILKKSVSDALLYIPSLLYAALTVIRILKKYKIESVFINDYNNIVGVVLKIFDRNLEIYTFVRRRPSSQNRKITKLWIGSAVFCSTRVIAVSNAVLSELPKNKKIFMVHNGLDIEEKLSAQEFPDLNVIRFVCIGNYMADKGHGDVLEAFSEASKRYGNMQLYFYGGDLGQKKNKIYKLFLKTRAEQLGVSDKVFVNDFDSDIEKNIKKNHVVLNCGYAESFSRVCVEAGWFRRPVIATRCGGPEEIVEDRVTGRLVDVGDITGISEAMKEFVENPDLIKAMGCNGRSKVWNNFRFEKFKENLLSVVGDQ